MITEGQLAAPMVRHGLPRALHALVGVEAPWVEPEPEVEDCPAEWGVETDEPSWAWSNPR